MLLYFRNILLYAFVGLKLSSIRATASPEKLLHLGPDNRVLNDLKQSKELGDKSLIYNTSVSEGYMEQISAYPHVCRKSCDSNDDLDSDRSACMCDENCVLYNDCCFDANDLTKTTIPVKPTVLINEYRQFWTCADLYSPASIKMKKVKITSSCPDKTNEDLYNLCTKGNENVSYSYLMDVPVVSSYLPSELIYANVFCAICNDEVNIKKYKATLKCNFNITSLTEFHKLNYQSNKLHWISVTSNSSDIEDQKQCYLDIDFPYNVGRPCQTNIIQTCPDNWTDLSVTRDCITYNHYVMDNKGKVFKNPLCAFCNGIKHFNLKCPDKIFEKDKINELQTIYSSDKYLTTSDKTLCGPNKIWDIIENTCTIFACSKFYFISQGKCIINVTALALLKKYTIPNACYSNTYLIDHITLYENETIFVNLTNNYFNVGEYEFTNDNFIKVCKSLDAWTPNMILISNVLICLSLICMLLHAIIFILLPHRRNIPSKNLFSMTCSLFIVEFLFVGFFHSHQDYISCFVIAIVIYYFLSVAFMWTNIMSIDVFRTFCSNTYKIKSKVVFIHYSICAWSIPIFSTILATFINLFTSETCVINPQFGTHKCWFNNKWGLVTFFTIPAGLIVLTNIILYILSVYFIYKQYKLGKIASITCLKHESQTKLTKPETSKRTLTESLSESHIITKNNFFMQKLEKLSDPSFAEKLKERFNRQMKTKNKLRMRLALYCKLALIMGLTWIFAFVSIHTQLIIFEYMFIVFNGLQGVFIFIAFDMKKKIFYDIKVRLGLIPEVKNSKLEKRPLSIDGSSIPKFAFSNKLSTDSKQNNVKMKSFKTSKDELHSSV